MIPLHLLAFFILYVATTKLLEKEVVQIASESASRQLDLANRELSQIAVAHTQDRALKHFFEAVLQGHQQIHLKLMLPGGRALGPDPSIARSEVDTITDFADSTLSQLTWISEEGDRVWMRGFQKVIATPQCIRCHVAGETLAVASMRVDVTGILQGVRGRSKQNVALLILAWAAALGVSTAIVKASIRRSTRRLEEDLAAAESGEGPQPGMLSSELILDPATARLHQSLQRFLERQRKRHADVADKLAHTDQLASFGRLAAGLAHEIKNPLAGIQGALEIMNQDAAEDDSNKELYDEMLKELSRVNKTLQTLLQSARPAPARLATTEIRPLIDDLRRLMEPGLRRQNIQLTAELANGELQARVDEGKLRQVLINLVQNAAEAMEEGGEIVIQASPFPDSGLVLAVQDNGPGISEEQQRKVFEPFFTTKFSGTGLGLAISRSLVEQHGGTLEVQSTPGEGTTFYILLPGAEAAVAEEHGPSDNSEVI